MWKFFLNIMHISFTIHGNDAKIAVLSFSSAFKILYKKHVFSIYFYEVPAITVQAEIRYMITVY